jgi:hypothetical protein
MNKFSSFKEYISAIDYDLFSEMAAHSGVKHAGTPSHLFDDDTLHYLHQFHPKHHSEALKFLFGQGMHDASKARHDAIEKHLEEKYPKLSEEERWMKFHDDPHNPIEAMDSATAKHKEEGIAMPEKGETYYYIPELQKIVEQHKKSLAEKGWDPKELGIMLKGYFHESHLKDLNLKQDARGTELNFIKQKGWAWKKVKSNKTRRYHVDTNLQNLVKNLEGHHFDHDELKNSELNPDTWHDDYNHPDHKFNTPNVDYGHPKAPDHDAMSDEDKKNEERHYQYWGAGGVSHEAIKTAKRDLIKATGLGLLGNHAATWTDRDGVEHQTELRQAKLGGKDVLHNATWTIECSNTKCPEYWDSDEDRMKAFKQLHEELEELEKDEYFNWKVLEFVNKESGSSITIDTNEDTTKTISQWINGKFRWESHEGSFKQGKGKAYHEKFLPVIIPGAKKAQPRYKVVHSTGSGAVHIPHIKNEIKYKEIETIDGVVISSEEKKEEVHQPVPNDGKYMLPFHRCLSVGDLYELKIQKPKDPNAEIRKMANTDNDEDLMGEKPELIHKILDSKTNSWRLLEPFDLKYIGNPKSRSGSTNIIAHWNKLNDKQKKCMKPYTNAHLNLMRAHGDGEEFYEKTGEKSIKHNQVTALGGHTLGTNNTQAHHPLHKYPNLKNFMNNEYHALVELALHGGKEVLVKEQVDSEEEQKIKQITTDAGVLQDVLSRFNGAVWKEAATTIYGYIQKRKHISLPMKATMLSSLEDISKLAVFRIVEHLGHREIGLGFERVVDEDGKVKFTYDVNKDPGKRGVRARKYDIGIFLNSYSQADFGTGSRRKRANQVSLDMDIGGDTESEISGAALASNEDLKRRIEQDKGGKWKAMDWKSDWHADGHSRHDIIRAQRGKGLLGEANKRWKETESVIQNKLNHELANWKNKPENYGKGISVPEAVVEELLKKILGDEEWLKQNKLGHIKADTITSELEKIKSAAETKGIEVSSEPEKITENPDEVINSAWDLISTLEELDKHGKFEVTSPDTKRVTVITIQQVQDHPLLFTGLKKRYDQAIHDLNNINVSSASPQKWVTLRRDKEEMLDGLEKSWKIISNKVKPEDTESKPEIPTERDTESKPEIPTERETEAKTGDHQRSGTENEITNLENIHNKLKGITNLRRGHPDHAKKRLADLEKSFKGGIKGHLSLFDQAAENTAKGRLRAILGLIKDELQKVA